MRANSIEFTLFDLQQAVRDYCEKCATGQPDLVIVTSYNKIVITINLYPGAIIEATAFRHRAEEPE